MPRELFHIGVVSVDVQAARRLTRGRTPAVRVHVATACRFIDRGLVRINRRHAARGRLKDEPVILAVVLGRRVLVDGWHRCYRARREGRAYLPAHLLGPAEAASVARDPLRYERVKV